MLLASSWSSTKARPSASSGSWSPTAAPDTDLLASIWETDRSVTHMLAGTETKLLAREILARYVGNYEFAPSRPAVISMDGDLLFLQEGSNPLKLPLAPNSETLFVS